ncbi:MAG: ATP-dependent helicase HrpB [Myxococcota bacterium]|nr:ATP-dependent helicase HrpB [Myxococcota bacterium]
MPLPVDRIVPALEQALSDHDCLLVCAPPGSGKTTRVPPAVRAWLGGPKVILLQPRRIAARASARRIAHEQNCAVGAEVGFRVRFENRTSAATRIEVLTEGLLTRQLQSDPFLEGVGAVILDEFHERSLHSDLALALLREVQQQARPDLKLVVMSATLEVTPVQDFLGGPSRCPLLQAEGRAFDVDIRYQPNRDDRPVEAQVAATVRSVVEADPTGHVLAFLPGVAEIERTAERLRQGLPTGTRVYPLHGGLKSAAQDRVLAPTPHQKVVLSTNLAETSLTIDGVTSVIDSGLVRRPRFDPRLGIDRLETVSHSQASATQRAGRAGRTRSGRCVRLWSQQIQALRQAHDPPAIELSDLTGTVLQLHAWGTRPDTFDWFEPPPPSAISMAENLLTRLGALEGEPGELTALGTQLARLPVHPRLGMVIVRGKALGVLEQAAAAAALASERDPWRQVDGASGDLLERLSWLDQRRRTGADPRALAMVQRVRDQLVRIGEKLEIDPDRSAGTEEQRVVDALLAGFPDRVGLRRAPGDRRLLLSSGVGAELAHGVSCGDCFVAVVLTAGPRGRPPRVRVTAEVDPDRLPSRWEEEAVFDRKRQAVASRRVHRVGALVLEERPSLRPPDPESVARVLHQEAIGSFSTLFPMTGEEGRLLRRLRFVARARSEVALPEWVADPTLLLPDWCLGRRSFEQLRKLDLRGELLGRLSPVQRRALETVAPDRMAIPSGSTVRLEYPQDQPPVLAARIQQLFGMMRTPTLGGIPITVHLLAPNGRPAQVTQDLQNFWEHTYAEVRKDLRGRYPRHAWPEDPSQAIPEDRPKRRR